MTLANKTNQELIAELEVSRRRISVLEANEINSLRLRDDFGRSSVPSTPPAAKDTDGIVIIFDRKLEFINDIFAALFGVSSEEALSSGFDPMTLIAPQSRRFIRRQYQEGCRGDYKTKQIQYTGLSRDGRKIECKTFLLFIPYKWGVAIQCTLQSVSASRQIDETLRRHYSDLPVSRLPQNHDLEGTGSVDKRALQTTAQTATKANIR
jgi:PAS domain-containing protein